MEAEWGSGLALGSIPELFAPSECPLPNLASDKPAGWIQWTRHSQSWCHPQGQGLGLAPSMHRSDSISSAPHSSRLGTGSGAQDIFERLFELPGWEQDQGGQQWERT